MTHSNERWYSVDGQLIDNKLVFNINEFGNPPEKPVHE